MRTEDTSDHAAMMIQGVGAAPGIDELASNVQKVVLAEGVKHPIGPGATRTPGPISQPLADPPVLVHREDAEPFPLFAVPKEGVQPGAESAGPRTLRESLPDGSR
jgi:hypothetical protein